MKSNDSVTDQVERILDDALLHYARVDYLNRTKIQQGRTPVDPDDIIFTEIPGRPGILQYHYTSNTPPPIKAAHVVGPKPCRRLTRWETYRLITGAIIADIWETLRRKR